MILIAASKSIGRPICVPRFLKRAALLLIVRAQCYPQPQHILRFSLRSLRYPKLSGPLLIGVGMVPRASRCPACILLIASLLLDSSDVFAQRSVPFRPSEDPSVLAPKLQKELGKALEALRANQPVNARTHLDAVYKFAPGDADANFLFGVYSAETDDWVQAKSYWEKVLV